MVRAVFCMVVSFCCVLMRQICLTKHRTAWLGRSTARVARLTFHEVLTASVVPPSKKDKRAAACRSAIVLIPPVPLPVRPGGLSANLLPLTISERVAHARLATLRRADGWKGRSIDRGNRRGRDGTNGGWTNRRQVNRTLTKRLHLSIDTLANTSGVCCFDIDREEEQGTQGCAN